MSFKSYWSLLPSSIVDIIYSYDSTYYDYMKRHILYLKLPMPIEITGYAKDSLFYSYVMDSKYCSYKSDILQVINRQTAKLNYPSYPLWSDFKILVNYTMKTKTEIYTRIMRKLIFRYKQNIKWYIIINTDLSLHSFVCKLLSKDHMDFMSFSYICLYSELCDNRRSLIDETNGKKFRNNFDWIQNKHFLHAYFTDFDIIIEDQILELDVLRIFSFHGKIYIELDFDNNYPYPPFYETNKQKYDNFLYYINQRLYPSF